MLPKVTTSQEKPKPIRQKFFASFVTAEVWRSPPRKASGKESGSFLKKRTKKLLQIQAGASAERPKPI
jgi:hypothetical protein